MQNHQQPTDFCYFTIIFPMGQIESILHPRSWKLGAKVSLWLEFYLDTKHTPEKSAMINSFYGSSILTNFQFQIGSRKTTQTKGVSCQPWSHQPRFFVSSEAVFAINPEDTINQWRLPIWISIIPHKSIVLFGENETPLFFSKNQHINSIVILSIPYCFFD